MVEKKKTAPREHKAGQLEIAFYVAVLLLGIGSMNTTQGAAGWRAS